MQEMRIQRQSQCAMREGQIHSRWTATNKPISHFHLYYLFHRHFQNFLVMKQEKTSSVERRRKKRHQGTSMNGGD